VVIDLFIVLFLLFSFLVSLYLFLFQVLSFMHGRRSLGRGVHPPLEGTSRVREFEAIPRQTMSTEGQQPRREDEGPFREEMTEETHTNRGQRMTMGEYALPDIGNQPSPIVLDPVARGYELRTMHVNLLPHFMGS
jgi:hypothetical protein